MKYMKYLHALVGLTGVNFLLDLIFHGKILFGTMYFEVGVVVTILSLILLERTEKK